MSCSRWRAHPLRNSIVWIVNNALLLRNFACKPSQVGFMQNVRLDTLNGIYHMM